MRADLTGLVTLSLLVAAVVPASGMQEEVSEREEESPWDLAAEMGASLFYGSSEQFAITARTEVGYERGGFDFETRTSFDYGEATNDEGTRLVSNRGWSAEVNIDYEEGIWAPFVKVGSRGSLQRRLDNRTSIGAGSRYRLIRNDRSRVDLSLSLAAERTDPRVELDEVEEITTKGRWSALLRARHEFGEDRMTLEFSSEYEPGLRQFEEDFVVDTEASLSYALTRTVDVELSFENTYDSLAGDRGAQTNSDGRIFFVVGASIG